MTPGALLQLAGSALTLAAVLARSRRQVRIFIGLAALMWLGRALLAGDRVDAAFAGAIAGLSLALLARALWSETNVRFGADERAMVDHLLRTRQ